MNSKKRCYSQPFRAGVYPSFFNQKHESMQNVFMHLGCTALFDYCFDPVYSLVLL